MLPTWRVCLATAVLLVAPGAVVADEPVVREEVGVVADWRTGLALHGMDPVAYFTDGAAKPGLPAHEFAYAGAVWRFRNEGNRGAFMADPEVYTPRFRGHDPMAIGRGVATPGDPLTFLIFEKQLYLFRSDGTRLAFRANPHRMLGQAIAQWPAASRAYAVTGSARPAGPVPAGGAPPSVPPPQ